MAVRQLPYKALAVGEDRTRKAEVVQRLEAPRDGEELHKGRRIPLVGAEADRSEREDENGAACPLLVRRHDDQVGEDGTDLMWMRKGDNDPSVSPVGEVPGADLDCATDGPDPLS